MLIELREFKLSDTFEKDGTVTSAKEDISKFFDFKRYITSADLTAREAPAHLPEDIARAFNEGTKCLAIGCNNAAASMFRLCLDLATKSMLPKVDEDNAPNGHQRRNLAPRLEWLFAHARLPNDLEELSTAVKDNGNDGAHDGLLNDDDTADLYDFAFALLERLYTHPVRLEAMKERRKARKDAARAREGAAKEG